MIKENDKRKQPGICGYQSPDPNRFVWKKIQKSNRAESQNGVRDDIYTSRVEDEEVKKPNTAVFDNSECISGGTLG